MCCPPDMVVQVWPVVRSMVRKAYDKTDLGNAADLDADVATGRALLWIVAGDSVECALVTRLETTQRSKVCFICALGGAGAKQWLHLIGQLEAYAKAEGCDCIRWMGRKGWMRKLPQYREVGVVMERRLDGRHK